MDKLDVQEDGKCLDGSAELQQMRPCWIGLRKAGATPLSLYYKTIHIKTKRHAAVWRTTDDWYV